MCDICVWVSVCFARLCCIRAVPPILYRVISLKHVTEDLLKSTPHPVRFFLTTGKQVVPLLLCWALSRNRNNHFYRISRSGERTQIRTYKRSTEGLNWGSDKDHVWESINSLSSPFMSCNKSHNSAFLTSSMIMHKSIIHILILNYTGTQPVVMIVWMLHCAPRFPNVWGCWRIL